MDEAHRERPLMEPTFEITTRSQFFRRQGADLPRQTTCYGSTYHSDRDTDYPSWVSRPRTHLADRAGTDPVGTGGTVLTEEGAL